MLSEWNKYHNCNSAIYIAENCRSASVLLPITMEKDFEELCLIDSGIKSIHDIQLPLPVHLRILNLHSNQISRLENLQHLKNLSHLDLSSNQIRKIEGLSSLVSLRTLNLSCNMLQILEGLQGLRSLVKLNISYNQISDLKGFKQLDPSYKLSHVELQGNYITTVQHLTSCLQGCNNLRKLLLMHAGATNPVCQMPGYRERVLECLPNLEEFDGKDRLGHSCTNTDILADIPGLGKYMDYLLSNSSSDIDPLTVATPKIDAALETFRQRGATTPEMSTTPVGISSDLDDNQHYAMSQPQPVHSKEDHSVRLEKLENQLAQLLYAPKNETIPKGKNTSRQVTKHTAKRDVDDTEESEDGQTVRARSKVKKRHKTHIPNYRYSTSASREKLKPNIDKGRNMRDNSLNLGDNELYIKGSATRPSEVKVVTSTDAPTAVTVSPDHKCRDDIELTYVSLMKELETERERRWKSEQATRKLVDHIKEVQAKAKEEKNLNEVAMEASGKLKQVLTNEREIRLKLQSELEVLQQQIQDANEKIQRSKQAQEKLQLALHAMESTATQQEKEHLQQQGHDTKKLASATMRAAANQREVELLQSHVTQLKGQLQQLQALLADREQSHKEELSGRFSIGSKEFQAALEHEVCKLERVKTQEIQLQQEKIDNLSKQYKELENEFRMALQIEANRFQKIQIGFERVSKENAENKEALIAAQIKDENSAKMITELTSVVKEQKGRLTELIKVKNEQSTEFREKAQSMDVHLDEARRRMVQLELLKKENSKLQSTVQAQESVIEGLKAERKLWGEELAQQGAALSQDRGRLDAKIEALTTEVSMLKKQLDRETDAVRIKSKLIEDQTETIRKLKEGLVERDREVRQAREEVLQNQKDIEERLASEMVGTQDMEEKIAQLSDRKKELKQEVEELTDKLEHSNRAHSILNNKWKQKSNLIGQLEQQVNSMKQTWEMKEAKLIEERDQAVNAASAAVEKLKSMDDAFRQQLDKKEEGHQRRIEFLLHEKQQEIDIANKRILDVEEEMRELLKETEFHKKTTEQKVKRLTQALGDLQQDLL